jgi:hypothetical protein
LSATDKPHSIRFYADWQALEIGTGTTFINAFQSFENRRSPKSADDRHYFKRTANRFEDLDIDAATTVSGNLSRPAFVGQL